MEAGGGGAPIAAPPAAGIVAQPSPAQKALWQAVTIGEIEAVEVLLESNPHDIDINKVDSQGDQRQGCTALHLAILEMPTWRGNEGRNGIQTHEFIKRFFHLLLQYGADIDRVCTYGGEWYLQTAAGKTRSFFPAGNNALGLVLQFIECTRGSAVVSLNVTRRLDRIRDIFLEHLRSRTNGAANRDLMSFFWAASNNNPSFVDSPPIALPHLNAMGSFSSRRANIHGVVANGDNVSALATDLNEAYHAGILSDVKVLCQNETIPAHRFILAARSPVFAAMLSEGAFMEGRTGMIEINDVSPRAFKVFLHFLYTDKWLDDADVMVDAGNTTTSSSSNTNHNKTSDGDEDDTASSPATVEAAAAKDAFVLVSDVLRLSNLYHVPSLKLMCSERICVWMKVETAAFILKISDDNDATTLRAFTMDYISKNAQQVVLTDAFKLLGGDLAQEVLMTCVLHSSGGIHQPVTSDGGSTSTPLAKRRREG